MTAVLPEAYLHDIRAAVIDWLDVHRVEDNFERAYVFGSLINRGGRHFIPSGKTASDVDLVLTFNDHVDTAEHRCEALQLLRGIIPNLEYEVSKVLQRTGEEPILSILPMTTYEIFHCIHMGNDPNLLTSNTFLDTRSGERKTYGLSGFIDVDYHTENSEPFSAIRLCQSYRNRYLRCNYIGAFVEDGFDGDSPFPKDVMRSGALMNFFVNPQRDGSRRTDLEEGNTYLSRTIEALRNKSEKHAALWDVVSGKSFSRANTEILSADQLLFVHEVMHDEARSIVLPSIREEIDRLMKLT